MSKLPNCCDGANASNKTFDEMRAVARSMMAEFNRKKKAFEVQKTKFKPSGCIDASRLSRYKVSENIFKRNKQLPEGKSHGVYVLVDTSGSMQSVYSAVIAQATQIAVFCKTASIPFKIVTFTDGVGFGDRYLQHESVLETDGVLSYELYSSDMTMDYIETFYHAYRLSYQIGYTTIPSDANLTLEKFFGTTRSELNNSIKAMLTMNGTPLYGSMIECFSDCISFRARHSIQNMNMLLISDGGDSGKGFASDGATHLIHPRTNARVILRGEKFGVLKSINALFGVDHVKTHAIYIAKTINWAISGASALGLKPTKKTDDAKANRAEFVAAENTAGFTSLAATTTNMLKDKNSVNALAKHIVTKFTEDYGF